MTFPDKKTLRKQYFIKKAFQTKFFIGFVALLLVQTILIGTLFMYISSQTLTTGYTGSRFVIDKTSSFFFISFVAMSIVIGIIIGLAGILVFIFLSHRIAGPLYRFEKTLHDLFKGNVASRIRLRRTDQLTELQDVLNMVLDKMDTHLKEIKKDVEEAHNLTLQYDREKQMQEVKEAIARIKQKIAFFKTS